MPVSVLAGPISTQLPLGTIIINVSGSFLIGFFGTLTLAHGRFPVSDNIRIFVMAIPGGRAAAEPLLRQGAARVTPHAFRRPAQAGAGVGFPLRARRGGPGVRDGYFR
jgi:hypothetical protein